MLRNPVSKKCSFTSNLQWQILSSNYVFFYKNNTQHIHKQHISFVSLNTQHSPNQPKFLFCQSPTTDWSLHSWTLDISPATCMNTIQITSLWFSEINDICWTPERGVQTVRLPRSDQNSKVESKYRHIGMLSVVRIFFQSFVSLVCDFLRRTQHH